MLIFLDGVPRSGKSYNTVSEHIVGAVKAGRHVYYRLKGLQHDKIAEYLKLPLEQVDALLHHVKTDEVNTFFRAFKDESQDGEWVVPKELENALVVIDEIHEFYVTSRQPMHPAEEQFFAKHGHHGIDCVIMTQSFKSLHSGVRRRIERMNRFQKLTAVGMKGHCLVTHYQSTAPEKFEKTGTSTFKYDPVFFPMYKGYANDDVKTDVYAGGSKSVWSRIRPFAAVMVVLLVAALWFLRGFFSGDHVLMKKPAPSTGPGVASVSAKGVASAGQSVVKAVRPAGPDLSKMPPDVAYVFALNARARARLAGLITGQGVQPVGYVEWRQGDSAQIVESLDLEQLRQLGVSVVITGYGVKLGYKADTIIVTSWPLPMQQQQQQQAGDAQVAQSPPLQPVAPSMRVEVAGTPWPAVNAPISSAYVPPELHERPSEDRWKPVAY